MPGRPSPRATTTRKKEHVQVTLTRDVGFRSKTSGLEAFEFIHNALPELNLSEIDTSVKFLEHTLALPCMVSCMTGGYDDAGRINRILAEACETLRIGMGVGSQRQAMESSQFHKTFSVVRNAAPSIPIVGNIGAAEVARMTDLDDMKRLVDLIQANAFVVHLNPLQEFLQPEGTPEFRGVLQGIERLVLGLSVPVIVKEIGAGLSKDVAHRLLNVGVRHLDVAKIDAWLISSGIGGFLQRAPFEKLPLYDHSSGRLHSLRREGSLPDWRQQSVLLLGLTSPHQPVLYL
jgi:isopentenyl-diphosphate Delta-isomerase